MAKSNLHIICGTCGDNKSLSCAVGVDINDDTQKEVDVVYIRCGSCNTLHFLDEFMPILNNELKN